MLYAFNTLLDVVPKIEVKPEDVAKAKQVEEDSSDNESDHNLKINEIQNNESYYNKQSNYLSGV